MEIFLLDWQMAMGGRYRWAATFVYCGHRNQNIQSNRRTYTAPTHTHTHIGKMVRCSNLETMTKSALGDRELYGSAEIIISIDKGKQRFRMHEHEAHVA